jgi:hypothetical protein
MSLNGRYLALISAPFRCEALDLIGRGKTMSKKADTDRNQNTGAGGDRANLDGQYRSIGISAVAAALPFVGKMKNPKNPAYPSADSPERDGADGRKRSVLAI